jgi:hypothetical protein
MRWGLDWVIGFIAPYTFTTRDYRQYSTIAILHIFQFTVPNVLGFSVFTSRILATDLSQSHCNFNSHTKSSWQSIIVFLPVLLNHFQLPSPEFNQILSTTILYSALRPYSVSSRVKVKGTLRLTASQSISLGVEHPPGAHDQIFITVWQVRSRSLTRGRVCLLYMLLVLASAVFLGS